MSYTYADQGTLQAAALHVTHPILVLFYSSHEGLHAT